MTYVTKIVCDACGTLLRDDEGGVAKEHMYIKYGELGLVVPAKLSDLPEGYIAKKGGKAIEIGRWAYKVKQSGRSLGKKKMRDYLHFCGGKCIKLFFAKEKVSKFLDS